MTKKSETCVKCYKAPATTNECSTLGTRMAMCSGCSTAWHKRNEEIRTNYPDSPIAPGWFDPADAGERWGDDY